MPLSWLCGHYLNGSAPENGLKSAPFAERQGGEAKKGGGGEFGQEFEARMP